MTTAPFQLTSENAKKLTQILKKYPPERSQSALLPLLDLVQRQNKGWLSPEAIEEVARLLSLPPMRVYEVATFYTLFRLKPVGKYLVQICRTTPCWLRGSDDLKKALQEKLDLNPGETTSDNLVTFVEVECLGGCVNAPVVQINDTYYEDLDPNGLRSIIQALMEGRMLPLKGRVASKACCSSTGETEC